MKKCIIAVAAVLLISAPAFAAEGPPAGGCAPASEQKSEMKEKHKAFKAKWDSLTEAQKAEVYALKDKALDAEAEIIDKFLEFGVIDKDTAAMMKTKISEIKTDMRKSGRMPLGRWKANK